MAKLSLLLRDLKVVSTNIDIGSFNIDCIETDSLKVKAGDCFICINGTKCDGHDFICTAVQRGASLIICQRITEYLKENGQTPYVCVDDTRRAEACMFNELSGRPSDKMTYVAVTGTNGKTSTTYFLRQIFETAGYKTGLVGTVKCFIGDRERIISEGGSSVNSMTTPPPDRLYPLLSEMADEGVEVVFMEASSHSLTQNRLAPLKFILGIFTNLTPEHLDYHHNMENYFEAKKLLLDLCDTAVYNLDDEYFSRFRYDCPIPAVSYSAKNNSADFHASRISDNKAVSYLFSENQRSFGIRCPIPGEFTVYNTLAAVTAARMFGIDPGVISSALERFSRVPGRMEKLELPSDCEFEVFIDYAHTPDALGKVLDALRKRVKRKGKLIAVFGCGGDRDSSKRAVMGKIATEKADFTVITADNSRTENPCRIIGDIMEGIKSGSAYRVIAKREEAIKYAVRSAEPGDVILLAGKGHEDYEIDSSGKHPFDERRIVYSAVENRTDSV